MNDFIADGRKTWRLVRNRISDIFLESNASLRDNAEHRERVLFTMKEIEMQLPVDVGDYTDFYASKEHATNVGSLFRDPENASPAQLASYSHRLSWEKFVYNSFRYAGSKTCWTNETGR